MTNFVMPGNAPLWEPAWNVRSKRKPYAHQIVGVNRMVQLTEPEIGRVLPGAVLLADEMRLGKTYQVINTAQVLFEKDELDTVIVVCPAPVRDVWSDPLFGEIQKHRWDGLPTLVNEYHQTIRQWAKDADGKTRWLTWIVTNYEYIRYGLVRTKSGGWMGPKLEPLLTYTGKRTAIVFDESSALANEKSLQTRACYALRKRCARVTELNGTPVVESPESIFSQARMLDPKIFNMKHKSSFINRYAIRGGAHITIKRFGRDIKIPTEIIGWRHQLKPGCCDVPAYVRSPVHGPGPGLEEIQEKMSPYVIRRIRKECMDLPPKLDPITLTATLKKETWKVYREMEDDMFSWLDVHKSATALQAGVKVMRLAQITSGFVGGVRDDDAECPECEGEGEVTLDASLGGSVNSGVNLSSRCPSCNGAGAISGAVDPVAIGSEKLDVFLDHLDNRLTAEQDVRMVAWCRFRPELHRTEEAARKFKGLNVAVMHGGQKRLDRQAALRLVHPDNFYSGSTLLLATLGTGSMGVSMAGAHEMVYISNDRSLVKRQQSEDRPHGPGQTQPVSYHDIIAQGPNREPTIDHVTMAALRQKISTATWTSAKWKTELRKVE